jgi:hypothetical protein
LMRWRRIFLTSAGSMITARIRIFEEQRGQTIGSISLTFAISLAHAERQADSGTLDEGGCGEESVSVTPGRFLSSGPGRAEHGIRTPVMCTPEELMEV